MFLALVSLRSMALTVLAHGNAHISLLQRVEVTPLTQYGTRGR